VPWIPILVGITAAALLLPRLALVQRYAARIFTTEGAPGRTTAIVFGAGLRRDGTPTTVLADRVATAATLYHRGRVQSILLSGSTRGQRYDEAEAMRALALQLGVPDEAIQVDKEGNRTLETCQRAMRAFGIHSALLVTQRFHLPRALVLCEAMGMQAIGVEADLSRYSTRSRWIWEMRELPASFVALVEAAQAQHARRGVDGAAQTGARTGGPGGT
jgi:vancomycin permeability regulator SanA